MCLCACACLVKPLYYLGLLLNRWYLVTYSCVCVWVCVADSEEEAVILTQWTVMKMFPLTALWGIRAERDWSSYSASVQRFIHVSSSCHLTVILTHSKTVFRSISSEWIQKLQFTSSRTKLKARNSFSSVRKSCLHTLKETRGSHTGPIITSCNQFLLRSNSPNSSGCHFPRTLFPDGFNKKTVMHCCQDYWVYQHRKSDELFHIITY